MIVGSRKGMTLIELLVVMAIMSIMIGLAFPIFAQYQKKDATISDAEKLAQLFNQARALQNNPDYFSRIQSEQENKSFEIRLSEESGERKATLYSTANPNKIIDSTIFQSNIEVSFQGGSIGSYNNLIFVISQRSPKEQVSCKYSDGSAAPPCNNIQVKFYYGSANKIVDVQSTVDAANKLFSVKVL